MQRHCEERSLRRSKPGFDFNSNVQAWIASSQNALLAMTAQTVIIMRFTWIILLSSLFSTTAESAPVVASHGMVVTEQRLASEVGAAILQQGGNAIDAAVAVGYALAVVDPCCGNIGGGGFMTIHLANGRNIFVNFREKAPLKASKNMFRNEQSVKGFLAAGVPGTVLGLDTVLQKYGTMTRKQVMAPAIQLADQGFPVSTYFANQMRTFVADFRAQPNVAAIFLKNNQPYQPGERLIQKELAYTLKLIAEKGPDVFYRGAIAKTLVAASNKNGGIWTLNDLSQYTVNESAPIQCHYRGYTILSAPPPSSGGVALCEMLNILSDFPLQTMRFHNATSVRAIVETMRVAFTDRNKKLGDPDFIKNPVSDLLSQSYAKKISVRIHELTDTTHYSVLDGKGNAVAVTYTINGFFGAKVIAGHTGFFLNNEMDDFATKVGRPNKFGLVQYDANAIAPGKRPLSSMTPTLVMKNNQLFMILGSPGGPRIITAVLLTLLNVIDYGFNIQDAVNAPRFHYQGEPDTIFYEPLAFTFFTAHQLEQWGYTLTPQQAWSAVEAILIDPRTHVIYGANDARKPDGAAIGSPE